MSKDGYKEQILKNIDTNWPKLEELNSQWYDWPLLDNIRSEIFYSFLIGCSQAAVTLTNHLLEKALKVILMQTEPNNQNFTDAAKIQSHYAELNRQYQNVNLVDLIQRFFDKGYIDENERTTLDEFRKVFRNAFGHADPKKTFGETTKKVAVFNPFVHTEFQMSEVKVKDFQFVQDTEQKKICDTQGLDYFIFIDKIIIRTLGKIFNR